MCLAQDAMVFRFAAGPDMLVMASLTLFYVVQLVRQITPGRPGLTLRRA